MLDEIGSSLPALARPIWVFSSLVFFSMLSFVVAQVYSLQRGGGSLSFLFGLFGAIVVGYGGAIATRPLRRNFRKGQEHAGDLVTFLLVHNPRCFKREWTRMQVAEIVRGIIIDETGVQNFSEDSHFINDMHLD